MDAIKSLNHLYFILKTNKNDLNEIFSNLDKYYAPYNKPKKGKDGTLRLKNGKVETREICPSTGVLKEIQKRIKIRILRKFEFQDYIQGGVRGKDNISNAKIHQGNKYFFTTDLRNFFPSVKYNDVYKMFISNGFSAEVSSVLTKLTTYKYAVPQGIPTSTYITNLAALPLDKELIDICKCNGIKYTRYVDDLSFSSKKDFRNLIPQIINTIVANKLKISHRKTKYKIGPTEITGIEVRNNVIKPSMEVRNKFEKAENEKIKNSLGSYIKRIK